MLVSLVMGVFLILKMIMFTDESLFLILQDCMGPGFNWVTYGIQLSMIYLHLPCTLPSFPIQPQSIIRKYEKYTAGEAANFSKDSWEVS